MARFNRRFEVKREMSDGGKIRTDSNNYKQNGGNSTLEQQKEAEKEANQTGGFDDFGYDEIIEEKSRLENLSEAELQSLIAGYQNMAIGGELDAKAYISSEAKKLEVDKKELETFLKEKGREKIKSPEKVLHYHRTSMEYAKKIIETGYLLNRKNIALNGGDISKLSGSSSANVQFTRDIYDENGEPVLLENEPQFEQGQQQVSCLTQSEIADELKQREDIVINSDKKVLEEMSNGKRDNSDITEEQQLEPETDKYIKEETQEEPSFEKSLLSAGFKSDTIAGLKCSIQKVSPSVLLEMDSTLEKTNEQTLIRGGNKDGIEQDNR